MDKGSEVPNPLKCLELGLLQLGAGETERREPLVELFRNAAPFAKPRDR